MDYSTVTNLVWSNEEHTAFDCMVQFNESSVPLPFTAASIDLNSHSQSIWQRGNAGEFGSIAEYVAPPAFEPKVAATDQPAVTGAQTL